MDNLEKWIKFLKFNVDPKKYYLWDMATNWFSIIERFIHNIKTTKYNTIQLQHIEIKKVNNLDRYQMFLNDINVTPSKDLQGKKNLVAKNTMQQYLQVLNIFGLIKLNQDNPSYILLNKDLKWKFPLLFNESIEIDKVIKNGFLKVLRDFFRSNSEKERNVWLSIMIVLLDNVYKNFDKLLQKEELDYSKIKPKKRQNMRDKINKLQSTYLKIIECLPEDTRFNYIQKFYLFELIDEKVNIEEEEIVFGPEQNEMNKNLFDDPYLYIKMCANKRRSIISEQIRVIRNYRNQESDLVGVNVPFNTLDAAHIKSVGKIKQEAFLQISENGSFIKNEIDKILSQIDDENNVLLLPHNYHYLFDKGYLRIDMNGVFQFSFPDSNVYQEFGIKIDTRIKKQYLLESSNYLISRNSD